MTNQELTPKTQAVIFGSEFGQQERLTVRLRGLVHNYPKGISILKEFVQNADDAGASCIKIILDWRSYPADHLPAPTMSPLTGPALVIYNDQLFTQQDIDFIQKIGLGSKGQSASKTGRFGLGFNACYNVTDYPMLLTGDSLSFFDPHHNAVPGATVERPGRTVKLGDSVCLEFPEMLAPFSVAGYEMGSSFFNGTIFRLPLRTPEQAFASEISNEPFTKRDFQRIVQKFTPVGAELLLFLKHLLSLTVAEIAADGASSRTLLEITTENTDEVRDARQVVLDAIDEDANETLRKLAGHLPASTKVQFDHRIRVRRDFHTEVQTWRLVSGLYVDGGSEVISAARTMLAQQEKALPWAGAACRIRCEAEQGKPSRYPPGKLYCFLPLPASVNIPVHLNGFFDLDSSRQAPTADPGSTGGAEVRVKWNELLVQHCVAQAYADLIAACAHDVAMIDPKLYYRLWPAHDTELPVPLSSLAKNVYLHLADTEVVPLAGRRKSVAIRDVFVVPGDPEHKTGFHPERAYQPLVLDGMPLADKSLPARIPDGFRHAGIGVVYLQPQHVRDRLRLTADINCAIDEAPRDCLRNRQSIVDLLRFCYGDNNPDDLKGVPLLLLTDGCLHTIGYHPWTVAFIAGERERQIFLDYPQWFIDPSFVDEAGVKECPKTNIYRMAASSVLNNLHLVLNPQKNPAPVQWNPTSATLPNSSWLEDVYDYLASKVGPQFQPSKEDVEKNLMVPDQLNRLWPSGRLDTPLLVPPSADPAFLQALTSLGIPLVTGSDSLLVAIQRFKDKASSSFYIWGLTAHDVADTLHAMKDKWGQEASRYDPAIHDEILNFFAHPEQVKDLRSLSRTSDRVAKLKPLPLFPTEDGAVVTGQTDGVYLPSDDYQPPAVPLTAKLLKTGKNNRWRDFLELLSFPELDRPRLIQDVLIPGYDKLDQQQQYEVLSWIRDNLSAAESQLERKDSARAKVLHNAVAEARLVRCTDGQLHSAKSTYDPTIPVIREVLGDAAHIPDMQFYGSGAESWHRFFQSLEMSDSPRAEDILRYVDQLMAESKTRGSGVVAERIARVFDHVIECWASLSKVQVADSYAGGRPMPLSSSLAYRSWLPAQRDPKRLANYLGYAIPADRLYKPSELYMVRQARLIISQGPVAALRQEPDPVIRKALGFPDSADLRMVTKHLDHLLGLWAAKQGSDVSAELFVASLNDIYRFFGTVRDAATVIELRNKYADRECLWDENGGRLWKPQHAFSDSVRFLESRRVRLQFRQDAIKDAGYAALGRRETPTIQDYIEFLKEIGAEYDGSPLPPDEAEVVLKVLAHLGSEMQEQGYEEPDLPVLTDDCRLVTARHVYAGDAPWYKDKLRPGRVHLLHSEVSREIILQANVKSLAQSISWRLRESPLGSRREEAIRYCAGWQETVSDPRFASGLLRLMRVLHPAPDINELSWLSRTTVVAVKAIRTELWISEDGDESWVGEAETPQYFEPDECAIFLKAQPRQFMLSFLADTINQQLDHHRLLDKMALRDIVDAAPDDIDQLLTRLRVPRFKEGGRAGAVLDHNEAMEQELDDEIEESSSWSEEEFPEEELDEEPDQKASIEEPLAEKDDVEGTIAGDDGAQLDDGFAGEKKPYSLTHVSSDGSPDEGRADRAAGILEGDGPGYQGAAAGTGGTTGGAGTQRNATNTNSHLRGSGLHSKPREPVNREEYESGEADGETNERQSLGEQEETIGIANRGTATPGRALGHGGDPEQGARPSTPGSGHSSGPHKASHVQDRLMSYVAPPSDVEKESADPTDDEREGNIEVGNAAVERVVDFESSEGRKADPEAHKHNRPGYDVESVSPAGEVRYIEVKGVSGPWDKAGVPLSRTQFLFAQKNPDEFWLYVVEFARDPERAQVYPIKNPASKVSQFRFDGGWKAVAEPSRQGPSEPAKGMSVRLPDGSEADILDVVEGGEFRRLVLLMPDGSRRERVWQAERMQLLAGEGRETNG